MRIILLISLLSLCSCGSTYQVRSSANIEYERKMKNVRKQDKVMFNKMKKSRRRGARSLSK